MIEEPVFSSERLVRMPTIGRPEPKAEVPALETAAVPSEHAEVVLEARRLNVFYGHFQALRNVSIEVPGRDITAIIGPSGCGKSTFIRCFNRMNDTIAGFRAEGQVLFQNQNIYERRIDVVEVRLAFGPRINGYEGRLDEIVERALRRAALWDEVKDKIRQNAYALSGGQQQRLCIARALAIEPEVILMDEPCSALDPVATLKIEDLMRELARDYTIVIVTHNMQQAARVSDWTAVMMMSEDRAGECIEFAATNEIFTNPREKRTEDYITGRFG